MASAFSQNVGLDGFISAEEGKRQLQQTGLPDQMLRNIWDFSDLDRDGRLSLREFVCAMYLANLARRGRVLPVEVRPDQQASLARPVERLLGHDFDHGAAAATAMDPFDASKPSRGDLSTADTAGSDFRGPGRLGSRSRQRQDFGASDFPGGSDRDPAFSSREPPAAAGLGFDSPGSLRHREEALAGHRGRQGSSTAPAEGASPGEEVGGNGIGLGQLASVLDVVARLDTGGELRRLKEDVLDERRELEQQLSRRRNWESQLREAGDKLDTLREDRRRVATQSAAAQRQISHLQDELLFLEQQVKDAEDDLAILRESGDVPSEANGRRGVAPYGSHEEERRDVMAKLRSERELLQRDQRGIEECRSRLDEVLRQKLDAQVLQQSLLEQQRQSEQDRGLMLTAIEAERGKLSTMRAQRIQMWEERSALEREMTDIAQERWLAESTPTHGREAGGVRGLGVPAEPQRHQAPSQGGARQPMKGVRQDDQPPPPVLPGSTAASPSHDPFGREASTGDRWQRFGGAGAAPELPRGGEPGDRSGAQRNDRRGVREEAPSAPGAKAVLPGSGVNDGFGLGNPAGWDTSFGGVAPPSAEAFSSHSAYTASFGG